MALRLYLKLLRVHPSNKSSNTWLINNLFLATSSQRTSQFKAKGQIVSASHTHTTIRLLTSVDISQIKKISPLNGAKIWMVKRAKISRLIRANQNTFYIRPCIMQQIMKGKNWNPFANVKIFHKIYVRFWETWVKGLNLNQPAQMVPVVSMDPTTKRYLRKMRNFRVKFMKWIISFPKYLLIKFVLETSNRK